MEDLPKEEIKTVKNHQTKELKTNIPLLIVISVLFLAGVVGLTYTGSRKEKVEELKSPDVSKLLIAKPIIPAKAYSKKLQSGPFICPTSSTTCQNGVYKGNSLSSTSAISSPVFAAFDGVAEGLISYHPNPDKTQEETYLVLLTNKEKGLMAYYSFKSSKDKATGKRNVKMGEQIATTNGQGIKYKNNQTFIFQMVKFGEKGGTKSALLKTDFK